MDGFVEELPQLPECSGCYGAYSDHACAALPDSRVRLAQPSFFTYLQALVVVGGYNGGFGGSKYFSSVVTLLPGATSWAFLSSLPRPLRNAQASIVGGKLRVNGGRDDGHFSRSEVMIDT